MTDCTAFIQEWFDFMEIVDRATGDLYGNWFRCLFGRTAAENHQHQEEINEQVFFHNSLVVL